MARSPRARSSAWRLRRRTWRAGCGGRSACRSATACSFAASRTRARRLARASQQGDLIVAAAGEQVDGIDALHRALDAAVRERRPDADRGARHRGAPGRDRAGGGGRLMAGVDHAPAPPASAPVEATPERPPSDDVNSADPLDAYSRAVVGVAERLAPAVASLRVKRRTRRGRMPAGAGSGVVLTHDGFILTSAHVVAGPAHGGRAAFTDGRELRFSVRRPRPALRPRHRPHRGRRPDPGRARRRRRGCGSASSWSRSATRTASRARSRPASSRRWAAPSRPRAGRRRRGSSRT